MNPHSSPATGTESFAPAMNSVKESVSTALMTNRQQSERLEEINKAYTENIIDPCRPTTHANGKAKDPPRTVMDDIIRYAGELVTRWPDTYPQLLPELRQELETRTGTDPDDPILHRTPGPLFVVSCDSQGVWTYRFEARDANRQNDTFSDEMSEQERKFWAEVEEAE